MRTGRSSLGWVGWMSVRLWLFFVLLWGSTGCGGDSSVLVTVLRADSETAQFVVDASLDGEPIAASQSFPASPPYFSVSIPSGRRGLLSVLIESRDVDGCTRAQGRASIQIGSDGRAALDVVLTPLPAPSCAVLVQLPDRMVSRVISTDGTLRCDGSCRTLVRKGSSLTLRVEPASGEHLIGFRAPCAGTEPCSLQVRAPVTVVRLDLEGVSVCFAGGGFANLTGSVCAGLRPDGSYSGNWSASVGAELAVSTVRCWRRRRGVRAGERRWRAVARGS